jgi:peptide deformylase
MATKKDIITLPNEHLRQRSKKVGIVSDQIKQVIASMKSATLDWEDSRKHEVGVALAAVQIDKPLRIVIIRSNFNDKSDRTFQIFINPKITKFEGAVKEDFEGCLSIRDMYGKVPRYEKIRVSALNELGRPVRLTASGFLARVFQHEIDHTNGIAFVDHIKDKPEAFFRLNDEGNLEKLDYEKDVKNNRLLW